MFLTCHDIIYKRGYKLVRLEVIAAVAVNITAFRDMTSLCVMDIEKRLKGKYRLFYSEGGDTRFLRNTATYMASSTGIAQSPWAYARSPKEVSKWQSPEEFNR
jgi:hypothetical protein